MEISRNIRSIQNPVIPIIGKLVAENPETISLGQGVIFYPPPQRVFTGVSSLDLNTPEINLYNPVGGIPVLLEKIKEKLWNDNRIAIRDGVNSVLVSSGANMAFFNALMSVTDPGDEIIILSPYYFNYEMAIRMFNCVPVSVDSFFSEGEIYNRIKAEITCKTKAVVTISPNNPTGRVYSEKFLREINGLCKEREIYHISDEAYEYFVYNDRKHFSPASIRGSEENTISLFSMSKSYGMAGWRVGYVVIPENLVNSFKKIQDTDAICPCALSQYAALFALETGSSYCGRFLNILDENRKYALSCLSSLGNAVEFAEPEGAIYFYIKVNCDMASLELAKKLIERYGVAVIPGNAFGSLRGCYLRLGFGAVTGDRFKKAIDCFYRGILTVTKG